MTDLIKKILLTLSILLALSLLLWIGMKNKKSEREEVCTGLSVEIVDRGAREFVSEKELALLLKEKGLFPIGSPMRSIQTKIIEDEIRQHDMIRMVECYKSPNGVIKILLEQRIPLFRVIGKGNNYYVDEDKKKMPTSDDFVAYVPVITGEVSEQMLTNDLYSFVRYISQDPFWNNQIEQININDQKEIQIVPRITQQIIYLGQLKDYVTKLDKLKKFYQYGMEHVGWGKYSTIDIRYKNQIVCKE